MPRFNPLSVDRRGRQMGLLVATIACIILMSGSSVTFAQDGKEDAGRDDLITRVYVVPPAFLPDGQRNTPEAVREILKDVGITFGPGSSARYLSEGSRLIVRNSREQIEIVDVFLGGCDVGSSREGITVMVEFIELDRGTLSDWVFENRLNSDGTSLREMLQGLVRKGEAKVIETAVVSGRSGQRVKTESVSEFVYPTEMDPAEIPEKVKLSGPATGEAPMTAGNATAFCLRNLGLTLEVDPVLGADGVTIDLNLAPEIVKDVDRTVWPNEEVRPESRYEMPSFYTTQIISQVTLVDGHYALLGTVKPREASLDGVDDPIIVVFVRADVQRGPSPDDQKEAH